MKKLILCVLLSPFLFGCSQKETTFSDVNVKNNYSISIPSYLEKTTEMGDIASLQYVNHKDEVYIMAIDESTSALAAAGLDNISKYYDHVLKQITDGMESGAVISPPVEKNVNGKKAIFTTISGRFNVHNEIHDAFYEMEVIQDSVKSLQIISWTMDHHEEKYGKDMDKMLESVKL
jgi:hypothetical protein